MKAEETLHLFAGYFKHDNGYMVTCPLHDDNTPSLSLRDGTDREGNHRLLVKCFTGCDSEKILDYINGKLSDTILPAHFIKSLRNGEKPRPIPQEKRTLVETYRYEKPDGTFAYQKLKFIGNETGKKSFTYRHLGINEEGKQDWIRGRGGNKYLFKLPKLIQASADRPEEYVFIVEGEPKTLSLVNRGLIATCNPDGASKRIEDKETGEWHSDNKWQQDFNQYFTGANVVLLPDNDIPGFNHIYNVCAELQSYANSIKVVFLPNLQKGEDVKDWFNSYGGTVEELVKLADKAEDFLGRLDDLKNLLFPPVVEESMSQEVIENEEFVESVEPEIPTVETIDVSTRLNEILSIADSILENEGEHAGLCPSCLNTGYTLLHVGDSLGIAATFGGEEGEDTKISLQPCAHIVDEQIANIDETIYEY